jgi:hypothetical protein
MLKICWRISDTDMQNPHAFIHSSYSLVGLTESSGERVRSFPSRYHHQHGSPRSCITWGITIGPLVAAVLRLKSHPIDTIYQIIKVLTAVSMKITALWDIAPEPDNGGSMYLWNVSQLRKYTALYFRHLWNIGLFQGDYKKRFPRRL